ncbi:hypothetical protein [Candidatus Anaplasma sp. TIGMIC]|uniref:hypothetical protein n=1 Tax=Candidatus Anaplasma sp. TIGMIC TaxID=3020713 RepID=UPI00232C3301|nr:hypothetical protein [Candidatus Anaplasma sp. TIGMIC]MDB1135407.1 hypothetical protein [Candidatus Anaplasma sp. TIGMIC]
MPVRSEETSIILDANPARWRNLLRIYDNMAFNIMRRAGNRRLTREIKNYLCDSILMTLDINPDVTEGSSESIVDIANQGSLDEMLTTWRDLICRIGTRVCGSDIFDHSSEEDEEELENETSPRLQDPDIEPVSDQNIDFSR